MEQLRAQASVFQKHKVLKKINGCATFARQSGVLVRGPRETSVPGVSIIESLKPHLVYESWNSLSSYSMMAVIEAESDAQMQERFQQLVQWM